ncbi:hypothetical protein CC78DRAFT_528033 [Lojkania enalia]|uniref:Cytochrome b5 heme-binding domain-containing protein n=1 Tax=Lojkania enalia TaxID=147567 RepID=A0A9P4NDF6_9PLEO|nr:hypothetical protein CC78DRAFT_528033 [Didymosphaeria enalia]
MLVGVSLLAISLSLLIYHFPPSTWRASLLPLTGPTAHPAPDNRLRDEKRAPPAQNRATSETQRSPEPTSSPQTTPKAAPTPVEDGVAIPSFSLAADESSDEDDEDRLPPPSFPALNSAQRTSSEPTQTGPSLMAPPPKPTVMGPPTRPSSSLMPPPPRIVPSNLRALPKPSDTMRVPTTGPLPNRRPPSSNGGLAPQPTGYPTVNTSNARGKVLLTPGHSPLDWANLQRSGKNLSGVSSLIRVTPAMLKHNNGRKGRPAWSSYQGKVYNITPYLPYHPGGEGELRRAAGKSGEKLFMETHPWVNWENMLGECLVGIMVSEEQTGSLEDMD